MKTKHGTLVQNILAVMNGGGISVSIEISPPGTPDLLSSIDKIHEFCHLQFCAVTWHLRNFSTDYGMNPEALQLAHELRNTNKEVLLHVAAKGLFKKNIIQILEILYRFNINNIFVLRGDDVENISQQEFPHAEHLVKFIRETVGDVIDICVAGYPRGHPECQSYKEDLFYLREKVNAGANFIITQIILDAKEFNSFVEDCRTFGIQVPILAGIMPIQGYNSFQRMVKLCHLEVPQQITIILEKIKDNPEAVLSFGIHHAVTTMRTILSSGNSLIGLHIFTMNRTTSLLEIMQHLGLITSSPSKPLPMLPKDDIVICQQKVTKS